MSVQRIRTSSVIAVVDTVILVILDVVAWRERDICAAHSIATSV